MKNNDQYHVITEQGDLGLGADVLSPEDQKIIKEQESKKE